MATPTLPYGVFDIHDSNGNPAPPHKRTDKWIKGGGSGMVRGKDMLLQPGESMSDYIPVGSWFDLSKPGTYTIQVSSHVSDDPNSEIVKSNILTITVLPPNPPAEEPK